MSPIRTALIVPFPETEEVVGPWRASLDPSAARGIPAHVTVIFPFLPPERIGPPVLAALGHAIAAVPRFDVTFADVGWFGDTVLWLAPRPDRPFLDLVSAVWRRFPEAPPYEGAYGDPVPHLTVGNGASGEALERAAAAVSARLPIRASAETVLLISGSSEPDSWHTVTAFPLGRRPGP